MDRRPRSSGSPGIQVHLNAPALQQPQTPVLVAHHVIGERDEVWLGEQPGHLGHPQERLVPEHGVEQNQTGYPLGVSDGIEDGIGAGRVVTDKDRLGNAQLVEYRGQLGPMLLRGGSSGIRPVGPAVSEEIEGNGRLGNSRGRSLS